MQATCRVQGIVIKLDECLQCYTLHEQHVHWCICANLPLVGHKGAQQPCIIFLQQEQVCLSSHLSLMHLPQSRSVQACELSRT